MIPENHIAVAHGKLTVNVPRSLFRGDNAIPDEEGIKQFKLIIIERYPWLNENSMEVLMRNARNTVIRAIDKETCGMARARTLISEGKTEEAATHLEQHLSVDPNNIDAWYMLGELLCKLGRTEEGYAAFRKGRSLI